MKDFKEHLSDIVADKMKKIAQYKEQYIEAWIAETGLLPSQCEIIEKRDGLTTKMWVQAKSEEDLRLEAKIEDLRPRYLKEWMNSTNEIMDLIIEQRKRLLDLEHAASKDEKS